MSYRKGFWLNAEIKEILGLLGQKSKTPIGDSQQGFQLDVISEEANMGNYTLDGTNKQITKQELAWLKLRLDRGQKEKFAEFGKLTPGLAAEFLRMNHDNRGIKDHRVTSYAADMVAGRWELNGESVTISKCGHLNDGQHRCKAVVISGHSIDVLFVFGVTYESRKTTDQGTPKTAGDYLSMDGMKNANAIAAIANAVLQYEKHGKMMKNQAMKPTKGEVRERAESDELLAVSHHAVYKKGASKVAAPAILGFAHYVFSRIDEHDANAFMESLISGASLGERNPIYVAREKLTDKNRRLNQNERVKCIFMAWNNWRQGKTVKSLTHSIGFNEKLPELK